MTISARHIICSLFLFSTLIYPSTKLQMHRYIRLATPQSPVQPEMSTPLPYTSA
ncbi:hypothetical protein BDQ17DRAFT_1379685 [Cyathus striatus]|nr:hypothetical protein BDQ17DRAFT_1379685 [Cyathus striatus]